jgi:hypothetical protein
MNRCLLVMLLSGFVVSPAVRAEEPSVVQRDGAATLAVTATLENNVIVLPFTDELTLLITVEGGAGLEVRPPEEWTKAPWRARPAGPPTRKQDGNRVHWSQALLVEPLAPGESSLSLAPLKYRDAADGEWRTATWQPIAARVTTKLAQPDLKSARDITAIEDLPALPPRDNRVGIWITASLLGAAGLAGGAFLWRRRLTQRSRATPEAWACYELDRLQALGLPQRGKHERFGTLLANLLRNYLEKKNQLPARRQTTGEFLAAIPQYPALADQREFLQAFLRRCDLLKFAPVDSTAEECGSLAEQVRRFITRGTSN